MKSKTKKYNYKQNLSKKQFDTVCERMKITHIMIVTFSLNHSVSVY